MIEKSFPLFFLYPKSRNKECCILLNGLADYEISCQSKSPLLLIFRNTVLLTKDNHVTIRMSKSLSGAKDFP